MLQHEVNKDIKETHKLKDIETALLGTDYLSLSSTYYSQYFFFIFFGFYIYAVVRGFRQNPLAMYSSVVMFPYIFYQYKSWEYLSTRNFAHYTGILIFLSDILYNNDQV